jgi:hypothetical protein
MVFLSGQEFLEATNAAVAAGLGLDHISTAFLRRLLTIPSFTSKEEAQRILDKRAQYAAKTK